MVLDNAFYRGADERKKEDWNLPGQTKGVKVGCASRWFSNYKCRMTLMNYTVTSLLERYDLLDEMNRVGGEAWPEFMLHDPVALTHWMELADVFRQYQLLLMDGEDILAIVNTVPLAFSRQMDELPDEGVDWGVKRAVTGHRCGVRPNILMGVQVVVDRRHSGKGLSTAATREMLKLAGNYGFRALIIPLRPSNKHAYPLIDMDDYIQWKNEKEMPFDNWLRVQVRMGGDILGICARSMYIPGTVREWQEWTNQTFPGSGKYIVAGALNPISIDIENDIGTYIEPNIWIVHNPENTKP